MSATILRPFERCAHCTHRRMRHQFRLYRCFHGWGASKFSRTGCRCEAFENGSLKEAE